MEIWFSFIMFLLFILLRVTHTKTGAQPCLGPHADPTALSGHADLTDFWTFSCLVMLNRHNIKKHMRLLTLLSPLGLLAGKKQAFSRGSLPVIPVNVDSPPQPLLTALSASSWALCTSFPTLLSQGEEGVRGLAVTREEIVPSSVWNYISRPAKQCQQRRESFDYAKWMGTSRLLLQ